MPRPLKMILLDVLGVACIIAAPITGWLPGPGGIPLFLLGLKLLSIHHKWADYYIDLVKEYADRFGDLIFVSNPRTLLLNDILATVMLAAGTLLAFHHAWWSTSASGFLLLLAVFIFLGNRKRFVWVQKRFRRKK